MRAELEEDDRKPFVLLLAEDDVLLRVLLADTVRAAGFRVVEAASADEAMAFLEAGGKVDLVLSDIRMPGSLDGLDLARRVRRDYPALPVVLTSGDAAVDALDGSIPFIPKPYDLQRVVAVVRAMLGRPQGRDES